MMKHIEYPNLEPLFRPKSIAIIGATEDPRRIAGLPLKFAVDHGYKGKLFPVNQNREMVLGIKCYPSVDHHVEIACPVSIPRPRKGR